MEIDGWKFQCRFSGVDSRLPTLSLQQLQGLWLPITADSYLGSCEARVFRKVHFLGFFSDVSTPPSTCTLRAASACPGHSSYTLNIRRPPHSLTASETIPSVCRALCSLFICRALPCLQLHRSLQRPPLLKPRSLVHGWQPVMKVYQLAQPRCALLPEPSIA